MEVESSDNNITTNDGQILLQPNNKIDLSTIKPNQDGLYRCVNCFKLYNSFLTLRTHLYQDCLIDRSYKCPFCKYVCKRKFNLKSHVARKHKTKYNSLQ